jgi:hypothetical protein
LQFAPRAPVLQELPGAVDYPVHVLDVDEGLFSEVPLIGELLQLGPTATYAVITWLCGW